MTEKETPTPSDETPETPETQDAPKEQPAAEETPVAETPAEAPAEKSEAKVRESKPATKAAKSAKAKKPTKAAKSAKAAKPEKAEKAEKIAIAEKPAKSTKTAKKAKTSKADAAKPAKAPVGPSGGTPADGHWWWGTGRRKTAVARVRIRPGTGKFIVNKKPYDEYFNEERDRNDMMNVLQKTSTEGGVDIYVNVHGGGYMGQAGAIVLGIARALRKYDETLEPILRSNAFLSRDPRKVERKKYGQRGARRKFQFSKR
ncbi:MAG: 30S ribosomal protein S9 [Planctomycetes bacterium]|nr:30S ribosomal protein S9 [Planctomycetota bacterium]